MYTIILSASDKHCPMREINVRYVQPGWMTLETIEALNDKYKLYKQAKTTTALHWMQYKVARNNAIKLIENAKEEFVIKELDNCGNDHKKLWKELHKCLDSSKNNNRSFRNIKDEKGNINTDRAALDFLNNYLPQIPVQLASSHGNAHWMPDSKIMSDSSKNDAFEFDYITRGMMEKLIKDLNVHKSSAMPGMSSRLLKDAFEVLYDEVRFMLRID